MPSGCCWTSLAYCHLFKNLQPLAPVPFFSGCPKFSSLRSQCKSSWEDKDMTYVPPRMVLLETYFKIAWQRKLLTNSMWVWQLHLGPWSFQPQIHKSRPAFIHCPVGNWSYFHMMSLAEVVVGGKKKILRTLHYLRKALSHKQKL